MTELLAGPYRPLVEYTRGGIVESFHAGAIAVVDAQGRLVASYGDPTAVVFLRSSAKPFQTLPLIESGAAEAFALPPREIALTCASHLGLDMHAETAASIQARIGASEHDLLCGTHEVLDRETARRLLLAGQAPGPNRHNCSGKHSGMLVQARHRDLPLADYINPRHPVQQTILATFAEMVGLSPSQVVVGVDGCSAPNFAVPLLNAALAFARLADPSSLPPRRANALRTVFYAMTAYPEMVRGPGGLDTEVMRRRPGLLASKGGAEATRAWASCPARCGPIRPPWASPSRSPTARPEPCRLWPWKSCASWACWARPISTPWPSSTSARARPCATSAGWWSARPGPPLTWISQASPAHSRSMMGSSRKRAGAGTQCPPQPVFGNILLFDDSNVPMVSCNPPLFSR